MRASGYSGGGYSNQHEAFPGVIWHRGCKQGVVYVSSMKRRVRAACAALLRACAVAGRCGWDGSSLSYPGDVLRDGWVGGLPATRDWPTDINKGEWSDVGTFTAPRFTLDDLEPGKTYWARSREPSRDGRGRRAGGRVGRPCEVRVFGMPGARTFLPASGR